VNESPLESDIDPSPQDSQTKSRSIPKGKNQKGHNKKWGEPSKETRMRDLSELLEIMDRIKM